jgi:hypothetical protein
MYVFVADLPEVALDQELQTEGCILHAFFTCSVQSFPPPVVSTYIIEGGRGLYEC